MSTIQQPVSSLVHNLSFKFYVVGFKTQRRETLLSNVLWPLVARRKFQTLAIEKVSQTKKSRHRLLRFFNNYWLSNGTALKAVALLALSTLVRVLELANINWIFIRFDPPNASFALLLTEGPNYEPLMRITLKGSSDTLICPVVTKMALVRPNYLKITFKVSGMAWGKLWVARRATLIEP